MVVHRRYSVIVSGTLFLVVLLIVVRQYVTKPWRSGTATVETRKLMMSATQLTSISKSANCCVLINEKNLQLLCNEPRRDLPANAGMGCTCADYLYCRLAVVTVISSNHFEEVQDMIHSAQKYAPNAKIFVYDLGLKEHERKNLSEHCYVEVRSFPFDKYPPTFSCSKPSL